MQPLQDTPLYSSTVIAFLKITVYSCKRCLVIFIFYFAEIGHVSQDVIGKTEK
jgi:hypothetical protein